MKNLDTFIAPITARIGSSMRIHMAINLATRLCDDPLQAKDVLQHVIDSGELKVTKIRDEESGEDIVFVGRPKAMTKILRECEDWVPDAILTQFQCKVLNILQRVRYRIEPRVLKFIEDNRSYWKYMDGDRECDKIGTMMGRVKEYLAQYPDGEFVCKTAIPDQRRYYQGMNPLSPQGNDAQRGLVHFASKFKVKNKSAIHKIADILNDEYGVNMTNYKLVVATPSLAFTNSFGLKGKKPVCTYAAALALHDLMATGESSYIVQQDQTCSGFQHNAMELGCRNLAILTNLTGGPKQDLYTAAGEMSKNFVDGDTYAYFLDRKSGKFFVLRIGYGAAAKSLARGLILANPREDEFQYLDTDGVYITNSLESLPKGRFNEDNIVYFTNLKDWRLAVEQSSTISKGYYSALMAISPKLQSALRMFKEANQVALDRGGFFEWTLPNGDTLKNAGWKPDPKAKKVRLTMRDQNDKKLQFSYMPMIRKADASAVAPIFIHSADGCQMGSMIIESYEEFMEPIAPIHDSTGASVSHFEEIGPMWKRTARRLWLDREQSMFFETMTKYDLEVPRKVWPTGWKPIDIDGAQYHLG